MTNQGRLIVIEGTDGSGKATQIELLKKRFESTGRQVRSLSFPRYGLKSAGPVELYLSQEVEPTADVSPYRASLYYAVDRSFCTKIILEWLSQDTVVLLDRYVGSNAGHQGGKIEDDTERELFLSWLYDLEYNKCGIPVPNVNIILHLPAEVAQKRKQAQKSLLNTVMDGHEADQNHLKHSEMSYLWLAKNHPNEYVLVSTLDGERELTPDEVHERVWQSVQKYIS